jgi:hypothetical protein
MPSLPGLDGRETAFAIWGFAILGFAAVRSGGFRDSIWVLLKLLLWSKLTVLLAVSTAYLVATIGVLRLVHYWDISMTKTTLFWFVGTALVTAFSTRRKDGHELVRLVRRHVSLAAALIYVMNIHPFPLYVWLVLVPLVLLLGRMLGLAQADSQYGNLQKPIERLLTLIGLAALAFSLNFVVSRSTARTCRTSCPAC